MNKLEKLINPCHTIDFYSNRLWYNSRRISVKNIDPCWGISGDWSFYFNFFGQPAYLNLSGRLDDKLERCIYDKGIKKNKINKVSK